MKNNRQCTAELLHFKISSTLYRDVIEHPPPEKNWKTVFQMSIHSWSYTAPKSLCSSPSRSEKTDEFHGLSKLIQHILMNLVFWTLSFGTNWNHLPTGTTYEWLSQEPSTNHLKLHINFLFRSVRYRVSQTSNPSDSSLAKIIFHCSCWIIPLNFKWNFNWRSS